MEGLRPNPLAPVLDPALFHQQVPAVCALADQKVSQSWSYHDDLQTSAYWQAARAADDDDEDTVCCLDDVITPGDGGYGNRCCPADGEGQCCLALSRRDAMLVPLGHCIDSPE